jgi:hypothetical protein
MKANEVNINLIGKKVKCVNLGEEVEGVIFDIYEDEEFIGVRIKHEPIQWGGDVFTNLLSKSFKGSDLMPPRDGNLKFTKLI